jgi:hypothetical protein
MVLREAHQSTVVTGVALRDGSKWLDVTLDDGCSWSFQDIQEHEAMMSDDNGLD